MGARSMVRRISGGGKPGASIAHGYDATGKIRLPVDLCPHRKKEKSPHGMGKWSAVAACHIGWDHPRGLHQCACPDNADSKAELRVDAQSRPREKLFVNQCTSCHGGDLKGSDKGPPLLHSVHEPSHHGDAAFQLAVMTELRAHHWNFGDMPPVHRNSLDEVAHITVYVRVEQLKAGIQ
jgi:hypothetical protein